MNRTRGTPRTPVPSQRRGLGRRHAATAPTVQRLGWRGPHRLPSLNRPGRGTSRMPLRPPRPAARALASGRPRAHDSRGRKGSALARRQSPRRSTTAGAVSRSMSSRRRGGIARTRRFELCVREAACGGPKQRPRSARTRTRKRAPNKGLRSASRGFWPVYRDSRDGTFEGIESIPWSGEEVCPFAVLGKARRGGTEETSAETCRASRPALRNWNGLARTERSFELISARHCGSHVRTGARSSL